MGMHNEIFICSDNILSLLSLLYSYLGTADNIVLFPNIIFSIYITHAGLHGYVYFDNHYLSYWVPQKLPQIYTIIAYICIGKIAWYALYICCKVWNTLWSCVYCEVFVYGFTLLALDQNQILCSLSSRVI